MNRLEAMRRLEKTSTFTFVGGKVLIRDARVLTAVAELRAQGSTTKAAGAKSAPAAAAAATGPAATSAPLG